MDKYGVIISQLDCLYQALLQMYMNKIALWIRVGVDDLTAETAIIASNETRNMTAHVYF